MRFPAKIEGGSVRVRFARVKVSQRVNINRKPLYHLQAGTLAEKS